MRIVELTIDEEIEMAGADAIALVEKPAVEEDFFYFSQDDVDILKVLEDELKEDHSECIHPTEEEQEVVFDLIDTLGEHPNDLEKDGWIIVKISEAKSMKEEFSITSNPNEVSMQDDISERTRYKYVGPPAQRNFCKKMMSANKVYRYEDIQLMSSSRTNSEFDETYDILKWRGLYNCVHKWVKITYRKDGKILNKGNIRRGVVETQEGQLYDTRTDSTKEGGKHSSPRVGGFSSEKTEELSFLEMSIDEEQRLITGPAAIPNKFIVRAPQVGISNEPYYVFFSEETIKQIANKYMRNKYTDSTNIEHTPVNLKGVYVTESWIISNPKSDKSNEFGAEYPKGTWMVTMKVENDEVWKNIKKRKLKGFSIEGYFTETLFFNKEDEQLARINQIIKSIK